MYFPTYTDFRVITPSGQLLSCTGISREEAIREDADFRAGKTRDHGERDPEKIAQTAFNADARFMVYRKDFVAQLQHFLPGEMNLTLMVLDYLWQGNVILPLARHNFFSFTAASRVEKDGENERQAGSAVVKYNKNPGSAERDELENRLIKVSLPIVCGTRTVMAPRTLRLNAEKLTFQAEHSVKIRDNLNARYKREHRDKNEVRMNQFESITTMAGWMESAKVIRPYHVPSVKHFPFAIYCVIVPPGCSLTFLMTIFQGPTSQIRYVWRENASASVKYRSAYACFAFKDLFPNPDNYKEEISSDFAVGDGNETYGMLVAPFSCKACATTPSQTCTILPPPITHGCKISADFLNWQFVFINFLKSKGAVPTAGDYVAASERCSTLFQRLQPAIEGLQ